MRLHYDRASDLKNNLLLFTTSLLWSRMHWRRHPYNHTAGQQMLSHCGCWGSNPHKKLPQLRQCYMMNM